MLKFIFIEWEFVHAKLLQVACHQEINSTIIYNTTINKVNHTISNAIIEKKCTFCDQCIHVDKRNLKKLKN